jgi:hypothetical protein
MSKTCLAILFLCSLAGITGYGAALPRPPASVVDHLKFIDWPERCGKQLPRWCKDTHPTAWTAADKTALQNVFTQLEAIPRVRPILEEFGSSDYTRLVKFKTGLSIVGNRAVARPETLAWVDRDHKGLYFNQRFPSAAFGVDPISRELNVKAHYLLHEIFHVIDASRHYSSSRMFLAARKASLVGIDGHACLQSRNQLLEAYGLELYADGWNRMRMAMQAVAYSGDKSHFLPSPVLCLEGEDGDREAFAELASFWWLDPRARTYIQVDMRNWLDQTFH